MEAGAWTRDIRYTTYVDVHINKCTVSITHARTTRSNTYEGRSTDRVIRCEAATAAAACAVQCSAVPAQRRACSGRRKMGSCAVCACGFVAGATWLTLPYVTHLCFFVSPHRIILGKYFGSQK